MSELKIGIVLLATTGALVLRPLAFLVGVQKRRGLINRVDWARVGDPDGLMAYLGALVALGGLAFLLIAALGWRGVLAERAFGIAVAVSAGLMAVAALVAVRLAQHPRDDANRVKH